MRGLTLLRRSSGFRSIYSGLIFSHVEGARLLFPGSNADVDASCAADYLNNFLFAEFLRALNSRSVRHRLNSRRWDCGRRYFSV